MTETIEVHNAYSIYTLNEDGSEADPALLVYFRPQDWGNPQKWHYEYFRLEWTTESEHYINHAHCWTDLKLPRHEYPQLFAQCITQIMMPGSKAELCGQTCLGMDDFWSDDWGPLPPYFDEESLPTGDDDFYE